MGCNDGSLGCSWVVGRNITVFLNFASVRTYAKVSAVMTAIRGAGGGFTEKRVELLLVRSILSHSDRRRSHGERLDMVRNSLRPRCQRMVCYIC